MDLGHMTLRAALETPSWRWILALLAGLAGIWGNGLLVEVLWMRSRGSVSLAQAFLQGTVLTAALLGLTSWWTGGLRAWPVALVGILAGGVALALKKPGRPDFRTIGGLCLVFGPFVPRLVLTPMPASDLTAIWTFHAKALVLEPITRARYLTEPVWAGSHPEYPLFLPLLHAHFFALARSFRDDWVRVWQVCLLLAFGAVVWNAWRDRGRLTACAAIAGVLALLAAPAAGLAHGFVELPSAIFAGAAALALLRRETDRLPLALAGLAGCKNEGLVGAWLFLVAALLVDRRSRPLLVSAAILGGMTLVSLALPSLHEDYPSRLRDLTLWRSGISNLGLFARGFGARVVGWPWGAAFLLLPVTFLVAARRRGRAFALHLWSLVMVAVFLSIYTVSPWGAGLLDVTSARLAAQIFLPAWFGVLAVVAAGRWRRVLCVVLLAVLVPVALRHGVRITTRWFRAAGEGRTGIAAYRLDPRWQRALALDAALPQGVTAAVLADRDYLQINYCLYPRRFYPASPDVIAGTWRVWSPWEQEGEVPASYRWVVQADGSLARPHPE